MHGREQKRRDKARETMEVYAPIANRLGILNVKEELEDRSLHYLDPVGYEEISKMLSERAGEEFLAGVSSVIETAAGRERHRGCHHQAPGQEHLRHLPQDHHAEQVF